MRKSNAFIVFLGIFLPLLFIVEKSTSQDFKLQECEDCLPEFIQNNFTITKNKKGQNFKKFLEFKLSYTIENSREGLLYVGDAQLMELILNKDTIQFGSFASNANLVAPNVRYLVPIKFKIGENVLKIRMRQMDEKSFYVAPMFIANASIEEAQVMFERQNENARAIHNLTLIVLLLISIYAFWRFMFFRHEVYKVYLLYVLSIIVFLLSFSDMFYQWHFLFPNRPDRYPAFNFILQAAIYALYAEFGMTLMDVKLKDKLLYKVTRLFQYSTVGIATFIAFTSFYMTVDALIFSYLYKLYAIPVILSTFMHYRIIVNFEDKLKWFLIAGSVLITSSTIIEIVGIYVKKMPNPRDYYFVNELGIITFNYVELCYLAETIIFLAAIGYMTWRKDREQDAYKEQTIIQLLEKEMLEKQVNELLSDRLSQSEKRLAFEKISSENERNKAKLMQSQLNSLQLQMNPHYLFNSLNSINDFIISKKPQEASEYLALYARMMRNILKNSDRTFNTLEQELAFSEDYLKLESLRFENRFDYKIIRPQNLTNTEMQIPGMMLQPILENAVWHGMMPLKRKGEIVLDASQSDRNKVIIEIIDNGFGILESKKESKIDSYGLKNIQDKIELLDKLYGKKISFEMINKPNGRGLKVRFVFPEMHVENM